MAIYEVEKAGVSQVLRQKAKPVLDINDTVRTLLDDMAETMYAAEGVGLAAPQVGIPRRMCVVDVGDGLIELINPVIEKSTGHQTSEEGCLSIPGIYGEVDRAKVVYIRATDRNGDEFRFKARDFTACALQHEIDHLDGILFTDKMKKEVPKNQPAEADGSEAEK